MRHRVAFQLSVALTIAATASVSRAMQEPSVLEWVRTKAIRLTTPEAGHGFDDMGPLASLIGDARIVSLGEATHGSREIFQLKHRMLEFLATERGFSLFAMEVSMPEARQLNEYVVNGVGDPGRLLRLTSAFPWDTEEVLAMVRWMREFNLVGGRHIEFTGFDMQTPMMAEDAVRAFADKYDRGAFAEITEASRAVDEAPHIPPQGSFGLARAAFPLQSVAGKRVRYSGYIKTSGVTRGHAGLWWRVDGASGVLAGDNMERRGAVGTSDWTRYEIELPVDASARRVSFGALLDGNGTAWFDSLTVEVDGRPVTDAGLFDLDFETAPPSSLYLGGYGFDIKADRGVAHTGIQSLRMQCVMPAVCGVEAPDLKRVTSRWRAIGERLETRRSEMRAHGATDVEIDWVVQCARIVVQGLLARSGDTSRDRSMADNVTWILDHHPGAKMVIWAHNEHVAKAGFPGETMGAFLRRSYGNRTIAIGSVFNEGSFQAMTQGDQSGLASKPFLVPPAPPGSLEGTLAAASLPLFALSLHDAPAWFGEPHESRQIGATYSEGQPYGSMVRFAPRDAFDALLFVERTSAAKQNPR